ncbi:MAG: hypothetical protein RJA49_2423 [Actinomycetota bacterium]
MKLETLRDELATLIASGLPAGVRARVKAYDDDQVEPPAGGVWINLELDPDAAIEFHSSFAATGQCDVRLVITIYADVPTQSGSGKRLLDRFLSTSGDESVWQAVWRGEEEAHPGVHRWVLEGAVRVEARSRQSANGEANGLWWVAEIPCRTTRGKAD